MSKMLRHLPSWDRLIYLVTSGFSSSSALGRDKPSRPTRSSTKPQRAKYADLENGSEGPGWPIYEMAQLRVDARVVSANIRPQLQLQQGGRQPH